MQGLQQPLEIPGGGAVWAPIVWCGSWPHHGGIQLGDESTDLNSQCLLEVFWAPVNSIWAAPPDPPECEWSAIHLLPGGRQRNDDC